MHKEHYGKILAGEKPQHMTNYLAQYCFI